MKLYCPKCGKQVYTDDMNLDTLAAKCHACHAVFGFNPAGEDGGAAPQPPQAQPERMNVPLPERIDVSEEGSDLVIRRQWYSRTFVGLFFFCLFWDGLLSFMFALMLRSRNVPLPPVLILLVLAAVGVYISYYTITGLFNTTTIRICAGRLTITHGPFPWPGKQDISTSVLRPLRSRAKPRQGDDDDTLVTYELHAILRDGRAMKLLSSLPEMEQTLYIEQVLEQRLGIQDKRVPGELVHY